MMGELKFFLGLQIIQKDDGIFIHQEKYKKDLLIRRGWYTDQLGLFKPQPMKPPF